MNLFRILSRDTYPSHSHCSLISVERWSELWFLSVQSLDISYCAHRTHGKPLCYCEQRMLWRIRNRMMKKTSCEMNGLFDATPQVLYRISWLYLRWHKIMHMCRYPSGSWLYVFISWRSISRRLASSLALRIWCSVCQTAIFIIRKDSFFFIPQV